MQHNYIGSQVQATCVEGLLFTTTPICFHKNSMLFLSPYAHHDTEEVEISYSSIVWIEKKKSLGLIPNRMIIYTMNQGEYTFTLGERDEVIDFLLSKTTLASQKPMNATTKLRSIEGTKIRRQYFNIFIYLMISFIIPIFLFLPLMETRINGNAFTASDAKELFVVFVSLMILSLPFILLSMINRFFFGKIICVLNEKGIYHKHGFIPWEAIDLIEYEIELPSRSTRSYCFARILGEKTDIRLLQAPHHLMKRAKKYKPEIKLKFTKNSIFSIILLTVLPSVIYIFFLIFLGA